MYEQDGEVVCGAERVHVLLAYPHRTDGYAICISFAPQNSSTFPTLYIRTGHVAVQRTLHRTSLPRHQSSTERASASVERRHRGKARLLSAKGSPFSVLWNGDKSGWRLSVRATRRSRSRKVLFTGLSCVAKIRKRERGTGKTLERPRDIYARVTPTKRESLLSLREDGAV